MPLLPEMFHVRQSFARPLVADLGAALSEALDKLQLDQKISKGQRIGITVGSRGIQNLLPILKSVVGHVRALGGEPYLLAAMGSHGGGTEHGQKEVLESLGVTEAVLGAKILTCARCRIIGQTAGGVPVHILESALEMDGILAVNRVKTHTSFKGVVESGLVKKLVVGLGGPDGAKQFHGFGVSELPRLLVEIGEDLLKHLPVLGGVAIVENAFEETALIKGIESSRMIREEAELLLYSKSLMPSLPVDRLDLLIVQEMGKNFSGTGMDTNIIGRLRIQGASEPEKPSIRRIAVLDLSEESHGNATGVGLADFVTARLVDKMDRQATYLNCLTSTFVTRAAIPMQFDTDRQLLEAAVASLSGIEADKLRIMIIPNTLFLTDCLVSKSLLPELESRPRVTIDRSPLRFAFDDGGKLLLQIGAHQP